jgi:hypothetical protein
MHLTGAQFTDQRVLGPQRRMHPTGDWRLWLPPPSEGRLDRHPVRDIAGRREKARCPRRRR